MYNEQIDIHQQCYRRAGNRSQWWFMKDVNELLKNY